MNSQSWKGFFNYYKWHITFLVLVIVCIVFVLGSVTTSYEADITIGFIGTNYIDKQKFEDNKSEFEKMLIDATDDEMKVASFSPMSLDKQKDINTLFEDMIETEAYHIYIVPKESFLAHGDASDFATLIAPSDNVETLKDSDGRVYAISLNKNTYVEMLGIRNPEELYIAAAAFGNEELSDYEKNGINIANYIVESRKKY